MCTLEQINDAYNKGRQAVIDLFEGIYIENPFDLNDEWEQRYAWSRGFLDAFTEAE